MKLKMFHFIEEVIEDLEKMNGELQEEAKNLKEYFKTLLEDHNDGDINVNSRVKSSSSLREKIIRNNYYNKYQSSEEVLFNLSDLIGLRIECRFIEDEMKIYKMLKKFFNKKGNDGYYYNALNKNIRLELTGKQPQEQKNGFEIFRIDGVYEINDRKVRFELQIKALVNIFWSELEHKIIYKNKNYRLADGFLKELMGSIKKNLTMIDDQLLMIYNQFNSMNSVDPMMRKAQLEVLLSKIIYDIFSTKMQNSIGFGIDFKKSCETIMKYIFRTSNAENLEDYNKTVLKTMDRLNNIGKNDVTFNSAIEFERDIRFEDEFSHKIGHTVLNLINNDFQWNLFFRILFEIELGNNAEDFETFITFIRNRFSENDSFSRLNLILTEEECKGVKDDIMLTIASSFEVIESIQFIYDHKIEEINEVITSFMHLICENISTYEEWEQARAAGLNLLYFKVLSIFNGKVETYKVKECMEMVKTAPFKVEISKSIFKYIDKLDEMDQIKAEEAVRLFKIDL
ncbi:GTP pyrophosphokinase family protein [Microbacteriaceae bacterium 4G12]